MKQCPHCNSEILDDSIFCDRCGKRLMACADCGAFVRGKFPEPIPDVPTQEKHTATLTSADGCITLHIDNSTEYFIGRKSPQFGRDLAGYTRMSRSHATIKWDEEVGRWLLADLHSTHGTMINQSKIDSDTYYYVGDGDTLSFANYEFIFADKT